MEDAAFKMMEKVASKARKEAGKPADAPQPAQADAPATAAPQAKPAPAVAEQISLEARIEAAFKAADDAAQQGGEPAEAVPQAGGEAEGSAEEPTIDATAGGTFGMPETPFFGGHHTDFDEELEVDFEPDDGEGEDYYEEPANPAMATNGAFRGTDQTSADDHPEEQDDSDAEDPFMAGVEAAFKAGAEAAFKKGAMAAFVADDDDEDDAGSEVTQRAAQESPATSNALGATALHTRQEPSAPPAEKPMSFETLGQNAIKAAQEDVAKAYQGAAAASIDNTESHKGGYVISVAGSKLSGILVPNDNASGRGDRSTEAMQIGALVKIRTPNSIAYGIVSSLSSQEPSSPPQPGEKRIVEIDLFGEEILATGGGSSSFQRGVSIYPALGEAIYSTTHDELAKIYARPEVPNVCIGNLQQDQSLPAHLMVDELLGKHFAILGTTGSGKSCTLAVIMQAILDAHPAGHVVLLDPHNEYGRAFGERAAAINPSTLKLPYWLLNFEEMIEVLCSPEEGARQSEAYILKDAITLAKREALDDPGSAEWLTVDTPVPYPLGALVQKIELAMGQMEKAEQNTPYLRLRARLENLRSDRRYDFMFGGFSVQDNMASVLSNIMRIPADGKPVTIFDLSGVPSEIVDVVVSLLCRTIFDFAVWSDRSKAVPVLLICEEAHRYVPQDPSMGFAPTRRVIAQIAKEGRKYGVSLGLVTQRPSELSETILSQCNTLFALRMSNTKDQEFVRRALPDSASGLLSALPALRKQEAIVVGEGVSLPMRICFRDLEEAQRPHSDTASFSASWQEDYADRDFIIETLHRWRTQSR